MAENADLAEGAHGQSHVFFLAAQRCNEFRSLPSGYLQFLQVPSLVCYAFSIELGLKSLALFERDEAQRGHDLKALFLALSPALRERLVAETGCPKSFDSDLELVRDTFDVWRYIHERGSTVNTDLGFLQRMATAVQKALSEAQQMQPVR